MLAKRLSIVGILVSLACFFAATSQYPGGFDWNHHFISTLLRGPDGPSRNLAMAGSLFFCVSLAFLFVRLSRAPEFARQAKIIQIAGIGSMVYSSLTMTVLHDLMVSISLLFFLVAIISLLSGLYFNRKKMLLFAGCICLAVLVMSATIYYSGVGVSVLPWAQRLSFCSLALWLVWLDNCTPRMNEFVRITVGDSS